MKTPHSKGSSFLDQSLTFSNKFHRGHVKTAPPIMEQTLHSPVFARFEKSIARKVNHAKQRILNNHEEKVVVAAQSHEYEYKDFKEEPTIQFSGVSLLLICPILLRVNFSLGAFQGIPPAQFLFFTTFVSFLFNLIFIIRKNRLMPYLPKESDDNRLKIACFLMVLGVYFTLQYGWSASGGLLFAIIWQSLAGRQGIFYLLIFGGVVGGSIAMEWTSPQQFLKKVISSVLFGAAESLLHGLKDSSMYAITNQLSLFLMIGSACLFPVLQLAVLSFWQYCVLVVVGLSVYFNLLLLVRLMQKERVSMVMAVMSGIITISASSFVEVTDYVGCLTVLLSILVLLKLQYLDAPNL